jgi:hypothetical protein
LCSAPFRCRVPVPISYSCGTPDGERRRKMLNEVNLCGILSDQLFTWSDEHTNRASCSATQTPPCPCASDAARSIYPARLFNREIQAMRQARMQMCRWARTWTQVLSFGELSGPSAADGLRAPRGLWASFGVSRELSSDARDSGRDLRDQPRVVAPARGTLTRQYGPLASRLSITDRRAGWLGSSGQYAGRLARRKPDEFIYFGGWR